MEGSAVAGTAHQVSLYVRLRGMPPLILAEDNSTAFNLVGQGGGGMAYWTKTHPDFFSIVPETFTVYCTCPLTPNTNFFK